MIISNTLLWIVGIIVFAAVMFMVVRKKQWSSALFRTGLSFGLLAAFAVVLLITLPTKKIVLIEYDNQANPPYAHKLIKAYGFPTIQTVDGESYSTEDLDLKAGKKYLFNCTDEGMLLYPVSYSASEGLFSSESDYIEPEPIYIASGCYDEIASIPDFWFEEAPDSIEEREHILESIWNSIFGKVEVKWCIVPYTLSEELEDAEEEEEESEE